MAFGTSIFLFAVGAILRYAITGSVENIDLDAVGAILMLVGLVGFVLSSLFWVSWAPFANGRRTEQEEVVVERNGQEVGRERHTRTSA